MWEPPSSGKFCKKEAEEHHSFFSWFAALNTPCLVNIIRVDKSEAELAAQAQSQQWPSWPGMSSEAALLACGHQSALQTVLFCPCRAEQDVSQSWQLICN